MITCLESPMSRHHSEQRYISAARPRGHVRASHTSFNGMVFVACRNLPSFAIPERYFSNWSARLIICFVFLAAVDQQSQNGGQADTSLSISMQLYMRPLQ